MAFHGVIPEVTEEWLEMWPKYKDERPVSVFFRFAAMGHLPEGVDTEDERVKKVIEEIKAAMSEETQ